jgi:hypothetical protein
MSRARYSHPPYWTDGVQHSSHPLHGQALPPLDTNSTEHELCRSDVLGAEEVAFVDDGRETDPDPRPWHLFLNAKGDQQ